VWHDSRRACSPYSLLPFQARCAPTVRSGAACGGNLRRSSPGGSAEPLGQRQSGILKSPIIIVVVGVPSKVLLLLDMTGVDLRDEGSRWPTGCVMTCPGPQYRARALNRTGDQGDPRRCSMPRSTHARKHHRPHARRASGRRVFVEGRGWVTGEVRMQWQDEQDAWWCEVTYRSAEHASSEIDAFPADRVARMDRLLAAALVPRSS
jgi:hypothetical protein